MKILDRNINVIDAKDDLVKLAKFDKFPIFMGCVNHKESEDINIDMEWSISKGNGIIQLIKLIPLDILYESDHNSGVVGGIWLSHHKDFANFIIKFNPNSVLEIGGGHGILSREANISKKFDWTIVEPNPSPAPGVKAKFIKSFFDENFQSNNNYDTIIHSHVFEHIYYPDKFLSNISKFLKDGQKLIFSIPNMEEMLKRKYTNCLNFEHTYFITEPYVDYLLSKNGFRLIEKQYFKKDHSIFFAYVKDDHVEQTLLPKQMFTHNKKIFLEYIKHYEDQIKKLNKKIKLISKKNKLFLFGAHIFSQFLIKRGLETKNIVCLLDNDQNKHNKRLYGTNLNVHSPKILESVMYPIIILKAGVYNEEIKKDILSNINSKAIFWE